MIGSGLNIFCIAEKKFSQCPLVFIKKRRVFKDTSSMSKRIGAILILS
jgi:hypothetical protein